MIIMRVFRNCPRSSVTRVISGSNSNLLDDESFIVISPIRLLLKLEDGALKIERPKPE